jgi:hypothetical protein
MQVTVGTQCYDGGDAVRQGPGLPARIRRIDNDPRLIYVVQGTSALPPMAAHTAVFAALPYRAASPPIRRRVLAGAAPWSPSSPGSTGRSNKKHCRSRGDRVRASETFLKSEYHQHHVLRNQPGLPRSVPKGRVLMHNHVLPDVDTPSGANGFLGWIEPEPPPGFVQCHCGWAYGLAHYARADVAITR